MLFCMRARTRLLAGRPCYKTDTENPFLIIRCNLKLSNSSMAAIVNNLNTSAQPELPQTWALGTRQLQRTLPGLLAGWLTWQYVVTFLLGVVVYDQGNQDRVHRISLQLTSSRVMYIKRKGSIAGPPFKIPLMGPFIQALYPKFEAYLEQWASGPLSCVSVFHKYVSRQK